MKLAYVLCAALVFAMQQDHQVEMRQGAKMFVHLGTAECYVVIRPQGTNLFNFEWSSMMVSSEPALQLKLTTERSDSTLGMSPPPGTPTPITEADTFLLTLVYHLESKSMTATLKRGAWTLWSVTPATTQANYSDQPDFTLATTPLPGTHTHELTIVYKGIAVILYVT
ncbi:MAG: hypothetical protein U1E76_06335 [Planctomycetota bacterium]